MPYFVYYVTPRPGGQTKQLEYLAVFDAFKEARNMARERRATAADGAPGRECRMIFAKNEVEAEKLLSAPRDERVIGED